MEHLAKESLIIPVTHVGYAFQPGIGYHIPNEGSGTLLGRTINLVHDKSFSRIVFPKISSERHESISKYMRDCKLARHDGYINRTHNIYNITSNTMRRLDHFYLFADMYLDSYWYKLMTLTVKNGVSSTFNRLPFQQLMLLDTLVNMIHRWGLTEHSVSILMYLKKQIGLDWLTVHKARLLIRRLSTLSAGHVVPRRCGKSSFANTILTLIIAASPYAGIKALYTAHDLRLVSDVAKTVANNVNMVVDCFNKKQLSHYQTRKNLNGGYPVPGDYYFKAESTSTVNRGTRLQFFIIDERGKGSYQQPELQNTLVCRVYAKQNTLRGQTFNCMFIDETNFLPPSIYTEILPMITTGKGRMILMSSQKCGQNNREFVDLTTVRMEGMLMNVVGYVCRRHVISVLRAKEMNITCCLCNFFSRPLHVTTGESYKRMLSAFGSTNGREAHGTMSDDVTMLSEVGGIPGGLKQQELNSLDLNRMQLANASGTKHMITSSVDVLHHISRADSGKVFHKEVVVYIDPAPTDVMSSYSAIAAVTRAEVTEDRSGKANYVILACEEFRPSVLCATNRDEMEAIADMFMNMVRSIILIYGGHFNRFIVAPEANAISVDRFWDKCRSKLSQQTYYSIVNDYNVTILSTVIEGSGRKERVGEKRRAPMSHSGVAQKRIHMSDIVELTRAEVLAYETGSNVNECEDTQPSFRLGYSIGANKVAKFWDFFSSCYNISPSNTTNVTCATAVYSYSLYKKGVSIPTTIANSLEGLTLRRKRNSGTRGNLYSISGKGSLIGCDKKEKQRDDLATAIICAVVLFGDIKTGTYNGRFLRLEENQRLF